MIGSYSRILLGILKEMPYTPDHAHLGWVIDKEGQDDCSWLGNGSDFEIIKHSEKLCKSSIGLI
jgi:hypothetical protein